MSLCKKSTRDPLLLAFQFQIVHNIVNCASNLKKWGIRESEMCIYCKKKNLNIDDTLVHAFIECQAIQNWLQSVYAALIV